MVTIANKIYMQTEEHACRSKSYNANAVQLKDHSRSDILDIPWYVPIYKGKKRVQSGVIPGGARMGVVSGVSETFAVTFLKVDLKLTVS